MLPLGRHVAICDPSGNEVNNPLAGLWYLKSTPSRGAEGIPDDRYSFYRLFIAVPESCLTNRILNITSEKSDVSLR